MDFLLLTVLTNVDHICKMFYPLRALDLDIKDRLDSSSLSHGFVYNHGMLIVTLKNRITNSGKNAAALQMPDQGQMILCCTVKVSLDNGSHLFSVLQDLCTLNKPFSRKTLLLCFFITMHNRNVISLCLISFYGLPCNNRAALVLFDFRFVHTGETILTISQSLEIENKMPFLEEKGSYII